MSLQDPRQRGGFSTSPVWSAFQQRFGVPNASSWQYERPPPAASPPKKSSAAWIALPIRAVRFGVMSGRGGPADPGLFTTFTDVWGRNEDTPAPYSLKYVFAWGATAGDDRKMNNEPLDLRPPVPFSPPVAKAAMIAT